MKLLAISEHYFPRVGGTVNYVHETLCALSRRGVEPTLLVPGPAPDGQDDKHLPYDIVWLDAGYPDKGDPSRDTRYRFCRMVNTYVANLVATDQRPDVLHVLFGLFVMEVLETEPLRQQGLPCIATVHNVPPMECRQVAPTAQLKAKLRETIRLAAVTLKNRSRLRRHDYDLHVTPSDQVRGFLEPIVKQPVKAIGHGLTSDLQAQMTPPKTRVPKDGVLRLLTVGGYAPHKRQHILPQTAALLRDAGLKFQWDVVGPTGRVSAYFDAILHDVETLALPDHLRPRPAVPFSELGALYDEANLYIQPSIEEGFCLTALDAAAAGLPVIASPAGALPDIAKASDGAIVESNAQDLANAILEFSRPDRWPDANKISVQVHAAFSWDKAAAELIGQYRALLS